MRFGVPVALGGALVLAGCSSPFASGQSTTSITPTAAVATQPTSSTVKGVATSTPVIRVAVSSKASPLAKAKAYLRAGSYKSAETEFALAISRGQQPATAYAGLGTAAMGAQDYPTGFRAYRSAAKLQPRNPSFLFDTADAALYKGDYHAAVQYATQFIGLRPKDPAGYHLRGLAYNGLVMHRPQLADAHTMVRLEPQSANAHNDLGIALANDGKAAAAVKEFSQAIRLQPRNPSYYMDRALAENLNLQPKLTLRDLKKAEAVARDPVTKKRMQLAIANFEKHGRR